MRDTYANMKVGELYIVSKRSWLLFGSKNDAERALLRTPNDEFSSSPDRISSHLQYWNIERPTVLEHEVSKVEENSVVMMLGGQGAYVKVLTSSGEVGWMIVRYAYYAYQDWFKHIVCDSDEQTV